METPVSLRAKVLIILAFLSELTEEELLYVRFKLNEKLCKDTSRVKKETPLELKEPKKVANG